MIDSRAASPLEVEAPERFSQTLLSLADECEFAAGLYAKHGGGLPSAAMDRGSAFHAFAETWLRKLVDEGDNSGEPEAAKGMLDRILRERDDLVVPGPEQDGLRAMCHLFAEYMWIDPSEVVAIEDRFDVDLAGETVTGRIDLATISGPRATIRDWKTSWAVPSTSDFVGTFQVGLYSVAMAEGKIRGEPVGLGAGITVFDVGNVYPRFVWEAEGTLAYRNEEIDYAGILDRKLYLERLVERTRKAFSEGRFHARPGAVCSRCPAQAECPIPLELRNWQGELSTGSSLEDAQRVAERHFFGKHGPAAEGPGQDADWKALKAWVDENGPLRFGTDLVFDFKAVEDERIRDKAVLREDAERAGLEWDNYVRRGISTRFGCRTLSARELAEEGGDDADGAQ